MPEASYVGTKGASPLSSMPVYWLESVGRVGEFPGRFPCRLAVADVVVAVTVGGGAQGGCGEFVSAIVAEAVASGGFRSLPLVWTIAHPGACSS